MRSDYLLIKPLHQAISQVKKFVLLLSFSLIVWSIQAQVAPTIQASGIIVTEKTTTTLKFRWTNGNGASGRLVVIKNITGVFTPADDFHYVATTTDFTGAGLDLDLTAGAPVIKSVFNGAGAGPSTLEGEITVTNLTPATAYTIQVYEYNINTGNPKYNIAAAANNPITTSTITTEPGADPSGLAFSNVAGRSLTLSWNAIGTPANSGTERIVIVNATAVSSVGPVDGTTYTRAWRPTVGAGLTRTLGITK